MRDLVGLRKYFINVANLGLSRASQLPFLTAFQSQALRCILFRLSRPCQSLRISKIHKMASTHAATIKSLDHLVLTVKSISRTSEWYTQNLGMRAESFVAVATPDITRHSLIFGQQKINLHQLGKVIPPYLSTYIRGD